MAHCPHIYRTINAYNKRGIYLQSYVQSNSICHYKNLASLYPWDTRHSRIRLGRVTLRGREPRAGLYENIMKLTTNFNHIALFGTIPTTSLFTVPLLSSWSTMDALEAALRASYDASNVTKRNPSADHANASSFVAEATRRARSP